MYGGVVAQQQQVSSLPLRVVQGKTHTLKGSFGSLVRTILNETFDPEAAALGVPRVDAHGEEIVVRARCDRRHE